MGLRDWTTENLFIYDPEPLEYQTAAMSLLSGLWTFYLYFNPDLASQAVSYVALVTYFPGWLWGTFWLAVGSMKFFGIRHRASIVRKLAAFLSAVVWSVVSYAMFKSGPTGIILMVLPIIALSQAWIYLRLYSSVIIPDVPQDTEVV